MEWLSFRALLTRSYPAPAAVNLSCSINRPCVPYPLCAICSPSSNWRGLISIITWNTTNTLTRYRNGCSTSPEYAALTNSAPISSSASVDGGFPSCFFANTNSRQNVSRYEQTVLWLIRFWLIKRIVNQRSSNPGSVQWLSLRCLPMRF